MKLCTVGCQGQNFSSALPLPGMGLVGSFVGWTFWPLNMSNGLATTAGGNHVSGNTNHQRTEAKKILNLVGMENVPFHFDYFKDLG